MPSARSRSSTIHVPARAGSVAPRARRTFPPACGSSLRRPLCTWQSPGIPHAWWHGTCTSPAPVCCKEACRGSIPSHRCASCPRLSATWYSPAACMPSAARACHPSARTILRAPAGCTSCPTRPILPADAPCRSRLCIRPATAPPPSSPANPLSWHTARGRGCTGRMPWLPAPTFPRTRLPIGSVPRPA